MGSGAGANERATVAGQPAAVTTRQAALPSLEEIDPRHVACVRMLVARLGVGPAHERDDLVQEVLLQAHRSKDSPIETRALLSGIARHVVFRWRARREHERGALKAIAEERGEEPAEPSAEDDWQCFERRRAVHACIEELPPTLREVFVGCEIDERPMAEVVKGIGIPVNTGYTRLHLARARFAEAIRRQLARRRIRRGDL